MSPGICTSHEQNGAVTLSRISRCEFVAAKLLRIAASCVVAVSIHGTASRTNRRVVQQSCAITVTQGAAKAIKDVLSCFTRKLLALVSWQFHA